MRPSIPSFLSRYLTPSRTCKAALTRETSSACCLSPQIPRRAPVLWEVHNAFVKNTAGQDHDVTSPHANDFRAIMSNQHTNALANTGTRHSPDNPVCQSTGWGPEGGRQLQGLGTAAGTTTSRETSRAGCWRDLVSGLNPRVVVRLPTPIPGTTTPIYATDSQQNNVGRYALIVLSVHATNATCTDSPRRLWPSNCMGWGICLSERTHQA